MPKPRGLTGSPRSKAWGFSLAFGQGCDILPHGQGQWPMAHYPSYTKHRYPMTQAQRKVLAKAASRERCNICPIVSIRAYGNAEMVMIRSLIAKEWAWDDHGSPRITEKGRAALIQDQY